MPTVAEPIRPAPAHPPPRSVEQHAAAILADLKEAGIRPTPLRVLCRALDVGLAGEIAVEVARTFGEGYADAA